MSLRVVVTGANRHGRPPAKRQLGWKPRFSSYGALLSLRAALSA
jgi:hypothetical protein